MSEKARQLKRVEHLIVTSGKTPTVLDLSASELATLILEFYEDRRFPQPPDPRLYEKAMLNGFDMYGVRFVKGRV